MARIVWILGAGFSRSLGGPLLETCSRLKQRNSSSSLTGDTHRNSSVIILTLFGAFTGTVSGGTEGAWYIGLSPAPKIFGKMQSSTSTISTLPHSLTAPLALAF